MVRHGIVVLGWILGGSLGELWRTESPAIAQIVPDSRSPEPSQVSPNPGNPLEVQINGGAVRGLNLFHSFERFSVPTGGTAFFNNGASIQNIIGRVTGSSSSSIDGLLRANGVTNLFLINPAGIVFGPNASLNIGGSFVATTANTVQFGTLGNLAATDPNIPLLTVNPSALLFNTSTTPAAVTLNRTTLQVATGQSLILAGGPVNLTGASLFARGGQVNLAGVENAGRLEFTDTAVPQLQASLNQPLTDVTLAQGSIVNVRAGNGGAITLYGNTINLTENSILRAGIETGQGAVGNRAGDITIYARSAVNLLQGSFIANSTVGTGNSGNVTIATQSMTLRDGAQVNASTFGVGNGGKVTIRAQGPVLLDGQDSDLNASGFFSRVNSAAVGNSGGIDLQAASLQVTNGALLTTSTLGRGNAGTVMLNVAGEVRFEGIGADLTPSGALSSVARTATGNSGGIQITAGSLVLGQGGQLDASTSGRGNAGSIKLEISDRVDLRGDASGRLSDPGGIYSFVGERAVGNSGMIDLNAGALSLSNGAALVTTTFGSGNAGNVQIQVTGPVVLDGQTPRFSTGIFSSVGGTSRQGNGGAIRLAADTLQVTRGAAIAASTLGFGNAGTVTLAINGRARFDGVGLDGFPSGVFSTARENAVGNGGDIQIIANVLELTQGAQLRARSTGRGNAGDIKLAIADTLTIQGFDAATSNFSGLLSTSNGVGQGGTIQVQAQTVNLRDRGLISAQSQGSGRAGDVILTARDRLQVQDGQITTSATQASGGAITLTARQLRLSGNSDVTTSVFDGTGGGGDIAISTQVLIALNDSDILAFSRNGRGGNITVLAPVFFGQGYTPAALGTDPTTLDGNNRVDINASGKLSSGVITLPDLSELQRSIVSLPSDIVDVNALIASSCIAKRQNQAKGSLVLSGSTGHVSPLDNTFSIPFSTYDLVPDQAADPVLTPSPHRTTRSSLPPPSLAPSSSPPLLPQADQFYTLANGDIILGRTCR